MIEHLRRISFAFFFILGLVHFIAGLLYINGHFSTITGLINRVSFIRFVLALLMYAYANVKHALIEYDKDSKTWNYVFIIGAIVVSLSLLGVEFFLKDSPTPLLP